MATLIDVSHMLPKNIAFLRNILALRHKDQENIVSHVDELEKPTSMKNVDMKNVEAVILYHDTEIYVKSDTVTGKEDQAYNDLKDDNLYKYFGQKSSKEYDDLLQRLHNMYIGVHVFIVCKYKDKSTAVFRVDDYISFTPRSLGVIPVLTVRVVPVDISALRTPRMRQTNYIITRKRFMEAGIATVIKRGCASGIQPVQFTNDNIRDMLCVNVH